MNLSSANIILQPMFIKDPKPANLSIKTICCALLAVLFVTI